MLDAHGVAVVSGPAGLARAAGGPSDATLGSDGSPPDPTALEALVEESSRTGRVIRPEDGPLVVPLLAGTGPVAVALNYADAEGYKSAGGTYAEEYQVYGVSGAYTIAPGLLLQSDLMFVDEELKASAAATAKRDSDSYVWLISTRVNF